MKRKLLEVFFLILGASIPFGIWIGYTAYIRKAPVQQETKIDTVYVEVRADSLTREEILREYRLYKMDECECYLNPIGRSQLENSNFPAWAQSFGEWIQ